MSIYFFKKDSDDEMVGGNFYDASTDDEYQRCYAAIKKILLFLLCACIVIVLVFGIYDIINVTTSGYITTIEPLESATRSTEEGSGFLVDRDGQDVKLKNTGTYDVLAGVGIIIDTILQNYPIVSINQTYINAITNLSCTCQNITTYINSTTTLTGENGVILLPNPWLPTINDGIISANITYINENIILDTLTAGDGLNMTVNPWNSKTSASTIMVDQTYINAHLNLSSLTQGDGIIMSQPIWNPSGTGSTISVNQTHINANLNLSSLTARNGVVITPNPWNPSTSTNAVLEVDPNLNQQGYLAIWSATLTGINGTITGNWTTSVENTWTKGGFDTTTGIYTVPSSGIYTFHSKVLMNTAAGTVTLRVNAIRTFSFLLVTTNVYILTITTNVETGDTVDIFTSTERTIVGSAGVRPWQTYFNANKKATN